MSLAVMRILSVMLALACAGSWSCGASTGVDADADQDADVEADADDDTYQDAECPPNVYNLEDTPCEVDGMSCGGPCTDPCSFCNLMVCMSGTWENVEAFPMPCFLCGDLECLQPEEYCRISRSDVVGIPDVTECVALPEECVEPTCECLATTVSYDNCTDENGEVTVEYFGG
jgi:hypothetical protein